VTKTVSQGSGNDFDLQKRFRTQSLHLLALCAAAGAAGAAPDPAPAMVDGVRPMSAIRPAAEPGWQADASAVLRGDLETARLRPDMNNDRSTA
jgi:hypothetical protein